MASAGARAYGVWGHSPQRGSRGQSPRWGVRGAKPPEADEVFVSERVTFHTSARVLHQTISPVKGQKSPIWPTYTTWDYTPLPGWPCQYSNGLRATVRWTIGLPAWEPSQLLRTDARNCYSGYGKNQTETQRGCVSHSVAVSNKRFCGDLQYVSSRTMLPKSHTYGTRRVAKMALAT